MPPKIDIPDGCSSKNDANQNICFAYNLQSQGLPGEGIQVQEGRTRLLEERMFW